MLLRQEVFPNRRENIYQDYFANSRTDDNNQNPNLAIETPKLLTAKFNLDVWNTACRFAPDGLDVHSLKILSYC